MTDQNNIISEQLPPENKNGFLGFYVDKPSDWVVFKFEYEGTHTWRSLILRDPEDKIRFSHMDVHTPRVAVISDKPDSCSYLAVPGTLPLGEWKIEFPEKWNPDSTTFKFEWEAGLGDLPSTVEIPLSDRHFWTDTASGKDHYEMNHYEWHESRENGARWYKGDFHTHTVLSDGKMTPERNMEQAEIMGLDFFVATDHNIVSTSWPKGKALVIPGVEITSHYGHWNALGLRQWVDWRPGSPDGGMDSGLGTNRLMTEVGQQGALRSINHPMLSPWAWMHEDTQLANVDSIEICNDPTYQTNPAATEKALVLWSTLWNEGCRLTGIGGSDSHLLPSESYEDNGPPSLIGDPATYVYAECLSAAAILAAVREGRVYMSRGPVLDILVVVDDQAYPLGSDLTEAVNASPVGVVNYKLTVSQAAAGTLHVIENGKEAAVHEITEDNQTFEFDLHWKGAEYVWRRFELRDSDGELLAFTNPVYYGTKERTITTWKQLLEKATFEVPVNEAQ